MNEVNRMAKEEHNREWLKSYIFPSSKIEDSYMAMAVKKFGNYKVLEMINSRITNPRFEIGFSCPNVNRAFATEPYSELLICYMDLIIPKEEQREERTLEMESIGDVNEVYEDDTHITYSIHLHVGPFALTINDAVNCINMDHGPDIERELSKLGITDYHVSFEITKFFFF